MLELLVTLATAAAPVDVVVSHGAMSPLTESLKGTRTVDATTLHSYLFANAALLPMQDFDTFKAPPISGWPAPLAETWSQGLSHCRGRAGPPPWRDNVASVVACARRLSEYLWQRYLAHVGAQTVWVVDVIDVPKEKRTRVSGSRYSPADTEMVVADADGSLSDRDALIERVIGQLRARSGSRQSREVIKELAAQVRNDPFAKEPVIDSKVAVKKTCDEQPATVTVSPGGVLADSFAARWKASTGGKSPAVSCTLELSEQQEQSPFGGSPMTVTSAVVSCNGQTASAEAMRGGARSAVDLLSQKLVVALAARYCR